MRSHRVLKVRSPLLLLIACLSSLLITSAIVCFAYLTVSGSPFGHGNDFLIEAEPALRLLYLGHLATFLRDSPGYAGSLLVRAPFSILGMALHSSWQTVYFLTAVPCLASTPLLCLWLLWRRDLTARTAWVWLSPLGLLLAVNPVFIYALIYGHPEDVLGSSLAIAATVQAVRGRPGWAGALVGAAVDNKTWALVAVPVVLATLPAGERRALGAAAFSVAVVYVPVLLVRGVAQAGIAVGASTQTIFLYPQLWWWFGLHSWVSMHAHELIVLAACGCCLIWRRMPGKRQGTESHQIREALLLLALVLFLRAAMDPWDNIYYQLPFLLSVYALEFGQAPKVSVLLTAILTAVTVPLHNANLDLRAAAYQAVAVVVLTTLALLVYVPERAARILANASSPASRSWLRWSPPTE